MNGNKMKEVKDKVSGSVIEAAGKVTDDRVMEYKGKLLKGRGKARQVAGNVTDEMEVVKNRVVGSVKEVTGKLTNDEVLQLRGKLQKSNRNDQMTNMILMGIGVAAGLYLIKTLISNNDN